MKTCLLHHRKQELIAGAVDAIETHLHLVTQVIRPSRIAMHQGAQPLAVNPAGITEALKGDNEGFKFLSQPLRHKSDFLPIQQLPLGVRCSPLAIRGLKAQSVKFFRQNKRAPSKRAVCVRNHVVAPERLQRFLAHWGYSDLPGPEPRAATLHLKSSFQDTVDDEVRVAADR